MSQGFARKVIPRAQGSTREEIEQEVAAIKALGYCAHENLIQIWQDGWLDPEESIYFIDMELCAGNLCDFIKETLDWGPFSCADHPRYLRDEEPPIWWRSSDIMRINFQLVNGTEYIHRKDMVHRDLKPQNGIRPSLLKVDISSAVLPSKSMLEDRRFWIYISWELNISAVVKRKRYRRLSGPRTSAGMAIFA